jgi:hypothetical protein
MEERLYDVAGGFRKGSIFFPTVYAKIDIYLKTAGITDLLGVDGIPIELCFVSQHAHRCIDMARISVADARLQL